MKHTILFADGDERRKVSEAGIGFDITEGVTSIGMILRLELTSVNRSRPALGIVSSLYQVLSFTKGISDIHIITFGYLNIFQKIQNNSAK